MNKLQFIEGDENCYEIQELISKGVSSVFKGINTQTGQKKCIRVNVLQQDELPFFRQKLQLWKKLNNVPGILRLDASFILKDDNNFFGYTVTDLAVTSLEQFVINCYKDHDYLRPEDLAKFIMSTLETLESMELMNIAHRNIKPENILLMNKERMEWCMMDVEVGFAVETDLSTKTRSLQGALSYLAPELFDAFKIVNFQLKYNPHKADMFSLGMCWIYAATFYRFAANNRESLKNSKYASAIRNLIISVSHRYPEIRGIQEILIHALHIDPQNRTDPVELSKTIKQFHYLVIQPEVHQHDTEDLMKVSSIKQTATPDNRKDSEGYIRFLLPKDFENVHFYNQNSSLCKKANFEMNDLCVMANDFKLLVTKLVTISSNFDLQGLKIGFEMFFKTKIIHERFVQPINILLNNQKNLKELEINAWNNQLRDPGINVLLNNLFLPQIQKLNLNFCLTNLTNLGLERIIQFIESCKILKNLTLDISMNQFTPESCIILGILRDIELTSLNLNLESNQINDRFCEELLNFRKNLQKIHLNISNTAVSDNGFISIGSYIENLPNLINLQIVAWSTQIRDKGLTEFFRSLQKNPNLQKLVLVMRNNRLAVDNPLIYESLGFLKKLQILELVFSNTDITDQPVIKLCKELCEFQSLREVNLKFDGSHITKQCCRYLARIPAKIINLKCFCLNISVNKIGPEGIEFISAGLKLSQNLETLELGFDQTECFQDGCFFLAEGIKKLQVIKSLAISMCRLKFLFFLSNRNELSSPSVHAIADAILKHREKMLQKVYLDFRNNDLLKDTEVALNLKLQKFFPQLEIKIVEE